MWVSLRPAACDCADLLEQNPLPRPLKLARPMVRVQGHPEPARAIISHNSPKLSGLDKDEKLMGSLDEHPVVWRAERGFIGTSPAREKAILAGTNASASVLNGERYPRSCVARHPLGRCQWMQSLDTENLHFPVPMLRFPSLQPPD